MVSRRHTCQKPGSQLVILVPHGFFDPQFEQALAHHLHFSPSHPRYVEVIEGLAHDFRQWVDSQPPELVSLGLTEKGSDGIVLTCNIPAPLLTPLPD